MEISGLHLLLTYRCVLECEHCFTCSGPSRDESISLKNIRSILNQAMDLGTIDWIYFEGGEPFLYYPLLAEGVDIASTMNFKVGIVTNGYWATSVEDATYWLKDFEGKIDDLAISSDLFHWNEKLAKLAENACEAAEKLGIDSGILKVLQPDEDATDYEFMPDVFVSGLRYRGRAAEKLVYRLKKWTSWKQFDTCPFEDLRDPGRLHVDPAGNVHICQGISIGNMFGKPLKEILNEFDPDKHPITGPLLKGGPAELVKNYRITHNNKYCDACHLCYEARRQLLKRFPNELTPKGVYGID